MKVLVTGATGFVGKKLVSELVNRNYKVSIFEKNILLESKDIPLKYLITLEPKPTPVSKEEREIINYFKNYAKNIKRHN